MKGLIAAAVLIVIAMSAAAQVPQDLPHMSAADARFYGIAPCSNRPCVTFVLYTISFCATGIQCMPIRVSSFEYTDADRCADQVNTMTPINNIGWYECKPWIVSQQQVGPAASPAQDDSRADSYAAKPFKHEPYVLLRCIGSVCTGSGVTIVSQRACTIAAGLAAAEDDAAQYKCAKQ